MPMLRKIMVFAKSPAGQKIIAEAARRAQDPATRAKVQEMARKVQARRSQKPPFPPTTPR